MISYNTSEKKKETEEDMEGGLLFQRHVQFSALNMPAREESFFNTADPGPSPNTMISGFLNDSDENDYQNTLDSQMFGSGMNDKKTEAGSRYSFGARLAARQGGTTSDSGGLKSTPHIIPHRLFTIPQGISPSMLIDSPILFSPIQALPSPTTGSFLIDMKKEEDNANESRGFVFKAGSANNAFEQIADMANFSQHNSFSSQEWTENGPAAVTSSGTENAATNSPSPPLEPEDQAEVFPQAVMERSSDDGYNWRKYGQKQVKGSAYPRSYYKCTHPNCPVKKKVERSLDGQVTEIVYKGDHSHEPPQKLRRLSLMDPDSYRRNLDRTSSGDGYSSFSQRSGSNVEPSSPSFEDDDTDPSNRSNADGEEDDLDRKRKRENEPHEPACAQRTIREPRVVVQTKSDIDILDDGYRWRKYGQKVVKGNPYPRSYYKCTNAGCPVRKHVERASNDPKSVITTYEAKHNHDVPLPKNSSSHENPYMSMLPSTSNAQMRSAQISATSIQDQLALAAVKNDTDLDVKDQTSSGSFPYRPQIAIRPKLEQDDGLSYTSFFNSSHQNNY